MANITAIVGLSGAAKTLLMSNIAWREYLKGRRIFANYYLQLDLKNLTFQERRNKTKTDENGDIISLNFTPIFEPMDLKKIPKLSNVGISVFLDEIDAFGADNILESGVDSYKHRSKAATTTEKWFKKRARKSKANVYYTAQQMGMVPNRIRDETENILHPKVRKWIQTNNPEFPRAPHILYYTKLKLDPASGKYYQFGNPSSLVHPLGMANHITPDMLSIYDTNADIFFKDDKNGVSEVTESESDNPVSAKVDPFRNPVTDESLFQECKKIFNHGTIVEKIAESGRCSEWKGDIIISPPGKPYVILDAVGSHKFAPDGITTKWLQTKNKYDSFSKMIDIDTVHKTKHYLAFYNKRLNKKDAVLKNWFTAPLDLNLAVLKEKNKKAVMVKDLEGIQPLNELSLTSN